MDCSTCGFENPEGSRFCEECGTPLALRCPGCDAELRAGQRFCGLCGTALTGAAPAPAPAAPASAPVAVRKTVTVLFADLGGSTGFGERNDAEIARQVLARYHALLQETIDAHAGTVAKFMGDGMMATWGIPEISEDDARRAVAAGADLQARFEELASDIERRHGETLSLRVGINTGEVVIGEGDADLIGDALNVAARLEKACRPGHVLVGEETWRLTRGEFGYEALGEVNVAGREQPVAIYEVAVEAEAESEVAAPFVGRDAEMQRLVGVFDDARQSAAARLTTVLGSPGVGKTRLSRELCAHLAEHGDAQSVELRCDRAGEATFAPVAQLIRDASGLSDDLDTDAARAAIGALLAEGETDHTRVVDVLAGLVGVGPARSVEETFWGVRRLVEATAATRPLVVVIDDIQWAEPLLLDLIEHLAEWVADAAVLVVGLARPELREVRPSLAEPGRPVSAVVVLDGLDASATEALAAGLLGAERLPAGLVERLPASTDGNPLFVRELVRMLVDDRVIRRRDDGEWELTIDADAVDVPPTIQSLLGARVERLPAPERELLEHASVVGAEFSLGALRELAGDSASIPSLLEAMRRKELVEPTGTYWGDEPVYRFHHVLIRDAAYRRLLKTTRAELHERVAEWTDRTAADLVGEHEAATAFHYEQAFRYRTELGVVDDDTARLGRRAAELLTIAAQRALGRDDLASAGALSARALALLPESDSGARADLLTMACECLLASGDGAAAAPLVEELGRSAGGNARLAAWAECYAAQLVALTDPEGLVAADERAQAAAAVLTELGDGSGQAKAHQVRAALLARLGRVGDAELELDLALAAARAADDRRRVTAVLGAAPDAALFGPSPVARAGGRCLDVVRLLRITTASPAVEAASNRCQAVLESLRGRFDVSRSMLATARAALEELGLRHGIAQTELYAGMVELIADDPHAAIPPLRAAFDGLGALGVGADAGNAAALLARALLVDGQVDEADELATASEQLAGQNLKTAIGWRVARAEVLAARGDLAGAVALAEQAVEIAAGTDLVIDHADACVALAALRAHAGDAAGARTARADAKRLYDQKGATVPAERLDEAEVVLAAPNPVPVSAPAVAAFGSDDGMRRSTPANAASDLWGRIATLFSAGRFDECGALCVEEVRVFDHRPVIGADMIGRDAVVANLEASAALGSGWLTIEPIAVRGSTLALGRAVMEFGDWGSTVLMLGELGPDGLGTRSAWFDEADLVAAQAELDAWYLAGEGAEQADAIRPVVAFVAAFHARDWDAFAEVVGGCEVVDHRGLWPETGSDAFVERVRSLVEAAPDGTIVLRHLDIRGDAALLAGDVRGTAAHGDRYEYPMLTVVAPGRIEHFDEHDLTAATARLEELGREPAVAPGAVTVENDASRTMSRVFELLVEARFDEMDDVFSADVRLADRRSIVGVDLVGRDALVGSFEAAWDLGTTQNISVHTIAVRGSRLVLVHFTGDYGDWANSALILAELGTDGRFARGVWFDESDLPAAIDELDAWYVAVEGAEHAEAIASTAGWSRAMNAHDGAAMRELCAPDLVFVDHRRLGTPPLDRDAFLEWMEGYRDVGFGLVVVDVQVRGRVQLITWVNRAVDADGGEILWSFCTVSASDARWRAVRTEAFAAEDRNAALARFEELGRRGTGPALENAASRLHRRVVAAIESGDDESLRALVSTDFHIDDRRAVVNFGVIGYDESAAQVAWLRDEGYGIASIEDLAVRGERLALSRNLTRTPAGEVPLLLVIDVDDRGRLVGQVQMDDDDLDAAFVELDERYLAGEGAEHAQVLGAAAALGGASTAVDSEQATPGFVFVDHRPLGWGRLDRDGYAAHWRAYADVRHVIHALAVRVQGRVTLMTIEDRAVDPDGNEIAWVLHILTAVAPDGRVERQEWFAELDWDAALARFEQLSAGSADLRTPSVENEQTRATERFTSMINEGRWDEASEHLAPDVVRTDHRPGVSAEPTVGPEAYVAATKAAFDVGFVRSSVEHLAVRGERLALTAATLTTDTATELGFLIVGECDAEGRVSFISLHDPDDLDAALMELDKRYLAGEGADNADVIRVVDGLSRRHVARDWTGLRDLIAEDTTLVDHRRLGWPSGDRDVVVQMFQELVEMVPDHRLVFRKQYVVGRAVLTTLDSLGATRDGGAYEWALHSLSTVDTAGRITAFELFAEDDWAAALARLDELGGASADPRTPRAENAATRTSQRVVDLTAAGRFDEATACFRPEFERYDRRRTVAGPPITSAVEYMDSFRAILEQFDTIAIEPIAVRGDRLHLSRTRFATESGFETVFWHIAELDDTGRICWIASHDEDDLDAALAELDERFLAGEGAAHGTVLRALTTTLAAMHSGDYATMALHASPDFDYIDRRRAAFGALDAGGFVAMAKSYDDIDRTSVLTKINFGERSLIARLWTRGVAADGVEVEWVHHTVFVVDDSGRALHGELFAEDDWDAALARFDELSAATVDPRTPGFENAAARAGQRLLDLTAAGRYDEAAEVLRPDFQRIDRRRTVAAPPINSATEYLESIRAILGLFDAITTEPVAVRGDSFYLSRSVLTRDGFETVFWAPTELDADGRLRRIVNYDEDDFAVAVSELDAWYAERERAKEAFTIRCAGDCIRSMASLDGAATIALVHPDVEWTDHRMLGFGDGDHDAVRGVLAARAEQIAEDRSYFRDLTVRGSTMMGRLWSEGIGPDGTEVLYEFHWVARWVAGRMHEIDWYDLDDVDAATTRFEALADAPPPAVLDNACIAVCERAEWSSTFGSVADAIDAVAPGIVSIDWRSGTGGGFRIEGRDGYVENQAHLRTSIDGAPRFEWLAVRGDRQALAEWTWTSSNGFEIAHLALLQIDDDGRLCRSDQYDVGDLVTAVAALDEWYAEGEGAEHADRFDALNAVLRGMEQRDPGALTENLQPDAEIADRRQISWPTTDPEGFAAQMRSYDDLDQTYLIRSVRFADLASLATIVNRGVDSDGRDFEWVFHTVGRRDALGYATGFEMFDEEAWDAAFARFDELSAASQSDTRTLDLENTATRSARLSWRLLAERRFDELPAVAPGFSPESRRRFLRLPEELDWLDALMLLIEQYSSFEVEPLAVRGRRAAVVRIVAGDESGNESPWIATLELDESDRLARQVNFDEEDEIAAIDLLDEWYIQGEGAADAEVLTAHREGMRRYHAHDWDWLRANGAPGFEFVDHRPLPWPTSDADGLIRLMSERVEQVPDVQSRIRKLFVGGRAILSVGDVVGTDEHGGLQQWPVLTVYEMDTAGANRRIEYFALEQWDAALARLDELAAERASGLRNPRAENAATRTSVEVRRLVEENRLDEAERYFADGYVRVDRRSGVTAPDAYGGRAFLEAWRGFFDVGLSRQHDEYLAVRGERLYVIRSRFETPGGDEIVFLQVVELDEAGLAIAGVNFDADDLVGALEELDARFVASGAATDAEVQALAATAALNRRDYDALTAMLSPDFVAIDHSPLGFPAADRHQLVHEQMAGLDAMVPDNVRIPVKLLPAGDTVLVVTRVLGTTTEGSAYEWTPVFVAHRGRDGVVDRIEFYAPEDWEAALARLDELAAEPPAGAPALENAAMRYLETAREFSSAPGRDVDDFAVRWLAEDVVRVDRRTGVSAPEVSGRDAYADVFRAMREAFASFTLDAIAIRGERLALVATVGTSPEGFELPYLILVEVDDAGRARHLAHFDEDALADALAELDARYLSGEGAEHAATVRPSMDHVAAINRRDWVTLAATMRPDIVVGDHRGLWPATSDREAYLARIRSLAETSPDSVVISHRYLAEGDASLATYGVVGTSEHGDHYEYGFHVPALLVDGAFATFEFFAEDDWDAALARFDELTAIPERVALPARPENELTRRLAIGFDRRDDGGVNLRPSDVAEDVTIVDHRTGVSAHTITGRDGFAANAAALFDTFSDVHSSVVAVRGERLALMRVDFTAEGFVSARLNVWQMNESGEIDAAVIFDDTDRAGAFQELEDRYVAGEGAADAYVIRRLGDLVRARTRRDWDAVADLCAPDLVAVDHRLLPYPLSDRDSFLAMQQGVVDLVPDLSLEIRTLEVDGDAVLMRVLSRGTSADGSHAAWEFWNAGRFLAGRVANSEFFDLSDEASARARFEELAALDPRTPALDNECVRLGTRHAWLLRHDLADGFQQAVDLMAPDLVQIDRRKGVSQPDIVGRDERLQVLGSFVDVFRTTDITVEYLGVRGERLALNRWQVRSGDGSEFELAGLDVTELDTDGRQSRIVTFDDNDLVSAVEELERRHEELSGDGYAPVERAFADGVIAANRGDFEAVAASHAAGYKQIDHAPLGMGGTDSSGLVEHHRALHEQVDLVLCPARIFVAGRVGLAYLPYRGTTEDGGEYVWELAVVKVLDEAGLVVEDHTFLVEQWDEALALFDDWSRRSGRVPENRATAAGRRAREAAARGDRAAMLDAFAPDFTRTEHRRRAISGDRVVGRELYVDGMLAGPDAGLTEFDAATLEVAGDAHGLGQVRWHNGEGFAQEWLLVYEADDADRLSRIANFDPEERDAAAALMHLWASERGRTEGAPQNAVTRRIAPYPERFFAADWPWIADMLAEGIVSDDRRTGVSAGVQTGRDAVLALTRALADVGFTSMTNDPIATRGDAVALFRRVWRHPDGYEVALLALMELDESDRMVANVMWDVLDFDAAIVELDRRVRND